MRKTTKDCPNGIRLEALIINNEKILTIHRNNHGNEYFVLPGGGWENGETKTEGVKREVFEETSLNVEVIRLVFSLLIKKDGQKLVYLCRYLGGNPKLGNFNEKMRMDSGEQNFYEPVWLAIGDLPKIKLCTLEFRDWFLKNYQDGKLPTTSFTLKITKDQFRE